MNEGDVVLFDGHAKGEANHWVRYAGNPVMSMGAPGSWDDERIEKHDILKRGSEYHLWYTGYGDGFYGTRIGYATSANGLNWTKHGSNPVFVNGSMGEWDTYGVERISVVWNGSMFLMWYNCYCYHSSDIGLATSPDGVNWTKYNDPSTPSPYAESDPVLRRGTGEAWDRYSVSAPSVLWNGTGYEMWYTGEGSRGGMEHYEIGRATSPDGIHWTKYNDPLTVEPLYAESDPVLTTAPLWADWDDILVAMPDVIIDEGTYKLWYVGLTQFPLTYKIGYATSPDGINWTKSPDNPVFERAPFGAWDDEDVWTPKVIRDGARLTMWYNGDNKNHGDVYSSIAAIGVAYYVSDEYLFSWDFDASVDSDADGSFTNDVDATGPTPTHVYGDNGVYTATLTVEDSLGRTGTVTVKITVLNIAPTIRPSEPHAAYEKTPRPISKHVTGLGGSGLELAREWAHGPSESGDCHDEGSDSVPSASPSASSVHSAIDMVSQAQPCDRLRDVKLVKANDDGGTTAHKMMREIHNMPASLAGKVEAYARGSLILRVAGEKWHDVTATVYRNGMEESAGRVVRTPGSPDDQAVSLGDLTVDVLGGDVWSARVVYTAEDDPTNGQVNGASPAWIIFRSEYGSESWLSHTFNVQHREAWTWDVPDLRTLLVGIPLDFTAAATDPGSDDLTFSWDWGDGTPATATTYFNDGIGPDSYPSPGGTFPFTATDAQTHAYSTAGTFLMTLRVSDDDGGTSEVALVIDTG